MESKLVKNRNDNKTTPKIALIKYEDVDNLNFLYRKLLQSNGYQVYFNTNRTGKIDFLLMFIYFMIKLNNFF